MWHSDRWSRMLMVSATFIEARGWEVLDVHPTTRLEYDESDHFHVIVMLTCFCKAYLLKLVIILFFILAWPRKAKGIQRYDLCQYVISENVDHFVNWRFDFFMPSQLPTQSVSSWLLWLSLLVYLIATAKSWSVITRWWPTLLATTRVSRAAHLTHSFPVRTKWITAFFLLFTFLSASLQRNGEVEQSAPLFFQVSRSWSM